MVYDWLSGFVGLLPDCVTLLMSIVINGTPLLGIIGACFILALLLRALLYKP